MKIPHKLTLNLTLITAVLTLPVLVPNAAAQVPCATPPAQPEGKITSWKQGATVNVMIDPTFTPTQRQAIKDQFEKWKNAGGANVTFKFVEPSQAGEGRRLVGHQSCRSLVKYRTNIRHRRHPHRRPRPKNLNPSFTHLGTARQYYWTCSVTDSTSRVTKTAFASILTITA